MLNHSSTILTPDPAINLPTLQLQILNHLTLKKDMYVCLKIEDLNIITKKILKTFKEEENQEFEIQEHPSIIKENMRDSRKKKRPCAGDSAGDFNFKLNRKTKKAMETIECNMGQVLNVCGPSDVHVMNG